MNENEFILDNDNDDDDVTYVRRDAKQTQKNESYLSIHRKR